MKERPHAIPTGPYISSILPFHVRFIDVDAMGIVWHGNYARYFEAGREDFGKKFGLSFSELMKSGLFLPLVHYCCNFSDPLRYDEDFELETRMFRHERAIIEITSSIRRPNNEEILAIGHTIQLFTDAKGKAILTRPQILSDFYDRNQENFHE